MVTKKHKFPTQLNLKLDYCIKEHNLYIYPLINKIVISIYTNNKNCKWVISFV